MQDRGCAHKKIFSNKAIVFANISLWHDEILYFVDRDVITVVSLPSDGLLSLHVYAG